MTPFQLVATIAFLACVLPPASGENAVTVLCSTEWFMVTVHPYMLNNDVYVHFYEVHLGTGCPANHVETYAYSFTYRVTECGIRVKAVYEDIIVYSSEIRYASLSTSSRYVIPLTCAAPRHSPWLPMPAFARSAGKDSGAVHHNTGYKVSTLAQSNSKTDDKCPSCIFSEQQWFQAPPHQLDMGYQSVQASPFGDDFKDFCHSSS
ncbi:placenta-specific protein 1 [Ochotona curzoniae]|uniref:placenta-specific protein 1 n=1 Tax=Ochotona curzoniae TaxID=130825 RepID=UPI001B352AAF|nr:placenta-specific protein 1 [Ochotona curzoniae]